MDALRTPIGGPPAEGIVRLRLPSPTKKQSTGLFFLPLLCFAPLEFRSCGSGKGLCLLNPAKAPRPLTLATLSRKGGSKAFSFVLLKLSNIAAPKRTAITLL